MAIFTDNFDDGVADALLTTRPGWVAVGTTDFARTDGAGGVKSIDTTSAGTTGIMSHDTGSVNHYVEVVLGPNHAAGTVGSYPLATRVSSSSPSQYYSVRFGTSNDLTLFRGAGTLATISNAGAPAGTVARLVSNGSTLLFFLNSVLRYIGVDTTYPTNTRCGFIARGNLERSFIQSYTDDAIPVQAAPSLGTLTALRVSNTMATISWAAPTAASTLLAHRWRIGTGTWTTVLHHSGYADIVGLTSNTSYTIGIQVMDSWGYWSNEQTISFTTTAEPLSFNSTFIGSENAPADSAPGFSATTWGVFLLRLDGNGGLRIPVTTGSSGTIAGLYHDTGSNSLDMSLVAGPGAKGDTASGGNLVNFVKWRQSATTAANAWGLNCMSTTLTLTRGGTTVATSNTILQDNDVLRVVVTGGNHRVYVNGTSIIDYTDAADPYLANTGVALGGGSSTIQRTIIKSFSYSVPDLTAPILTGPLTAGLVASNSAQFSFVSATDNVAVTSFEYSLVSQGSPAGTWISVTPSGNTFSVSGLTPETQYTVYLRSKDFMGNISNVLSLDFTTDIVKGFLLLAGPDNVFKKTETGAVLANTSTQLRFFNPVTLSHVVTLTYVTDAQGNLPVISSPLLLAGTDYLMYYQMTGGEYGAVKITTQV